jgi:DNA-binding NarL/FixJ family response regulator
VIRVFIADDQLLIRQGIRTLLEMDGGISVVGEAADGIEATTRVPALPVDVLLLDIRMPQKNGIDVLRELSAKGALPLDADPHHFRRQRRGAGRHSRRRARIHAQGRFL